MYEFNNLSKPMFFFFGSLFLFALAHETKRKSEQRNLFLLFMILVVGSNIRELEIILEKLSDKIKVRANVVNKFQFNQRILAFAEECKILEPQWAKEKFFEHLNKIIGVYENENT